MDKMLIMSYLEAILSLLVAIGTGSITALLSSRFYYKKQRWEYKVKAYTELLAAFATLATHAHDKGGEKQQTAQRAFFTKVSTVLPFADKGVVNVLSVFMKAATNKNEACDPRPFAENLVRAIRKDLGASELEVIPEYLYVVGEANLPMTRNNAPKIVQR